MAKQLITTKEINQAIKEWSPSLKDFALVDFNQKHFFKSAILAISENKDLKECLQTQEGRSSLYNAMKRAFSTGLSLNPQEGKAVIIAYNGKASYQIMKEGAIEIVLRSGDVKGILVEIVYENDHFAIKKTSNGDEYEFIPARKERGNVDGYFCAISLNDDKSYIKWMTVAECHEIRDNYSSMFKNRKDLSPWSKSEKGMCKKTVIKAAIRDLHLSPTAKAQFSSEDLSFEDNKSEPKDITPPKTTGSSQADVVDKLTSADTKKDNKNSEKSQEPKEKVSKDDRF